MLPEFQADDIYTPYDVVPAISSSVIVRGYYVTDCVSCATSYGPVTSSSRSRKLVLLDLPLLPHPAPRPLPLRQPPVCSSSFLSCFVCLFASFFRFHTEVKSYGS